MTELIQLAFNVVRRTDEDSVTNSIVEAGLGLTTAVIMLASFMKDDSFEEEKEWRVVLGPIYPKSDDIRFRTSKGYLIPYINFLLAEEKESVNLHNVCLGPSPEPVMLQQSLESLLTAKHISDCEIQKTRTPYRSW